MSNNFDIYKPKKPIGPPPPPVPPHLNPKVTNIYIDAGKNGTEQIYTTIGAMEARLQSLEIWARDVAGVTLGYTDTTAYPGNEGSENRRRITDLESLIGPISGISIDNINSISSQIIEISSNLAAYVTTNYLNNVFLTDITNEISRNREEVESSVTDVRDELYELSGRLSGNVDTANVSAIVTSIMTEFIHEEDDYSEILGKITDFNDEMG